MSRHRLDFRHVASMRPPAKQAENPSFERRSTRRAYGFNEAACKTGGKPRHRLDPRTKTADASMRPPAKQAETDRLRPGASPALVCFNEAACKTGGKRQHHPVRRLRRLASMRPPAKQAENDRCPAGDSGARRASMRPPAKQAENLVKLVILDPGGWGFNEAACKTGGKLLRMILDHADAVIASMRPPAKQAENPDSLRR